MGIDPKSLPLNFLKAMTPEQRRPMGKAGVLPSEAEEKRLMKGERELQTTLTGYLRMRGVVAAVPRFGKKSTLDPSGWPDITFSLHGAACAWEVKFEKRKPSPEQEKVMAEMAAPPNCWHVAVIRSVEEAKDFLDRLEKVLAS